MDVYEAISMDHFVHGGWGSLSDAGGGGAQVLSTGDPHEPAAALHWCHGCGDRVPQLYDDALCALCSELDARLDAHVGAAMEDFAERALSVVLDYLHPDDVQRVIAGILEERGGSGEELRRLAVRFARSHAYVDARARRAREEAIPEEPDGPRGE
jgi:hypothetical protein